MGYTTDFEGYMELKQTEVKNIDGKGVNLNLTIDEVMTLVKGIAKTRRMGRDLSKISNEDGMLNGIHYSEYGVEGEFYYNPDCFNHEFFNEKEDKSTIQFSGKENKNQPGYWLQWIIEKELDTEKNETI